MTKRAKAADLISWHGNAPFGVIDIGSGSVRLVIFERIARNPWPLFNERIVCGIGRDMVSSGKLHEEGTARALQALARFRTLAEGMNVSGLRVVATAAVRDASNGDEFVTRAEAQIGSRVEVLTGEGEARLAAHGVMFGIPDADGLVGDLGGGSLELMEVSGGKLGRCATFPLGPLRLVDAAGGKVNAARDIINRTFEKTDWLGRFKGRTLYLVGGMWRNFSSILMEQQGHPLRVLQGYSVSASKAKSLAIVFGQMSADSLRQIESLSSRRVDTMSYGAAVLEHLIKATGVGTVATSAYGIREGVLLEALNDEERVADPLLSAAADLNVQLSRSPGHALELHRWIAPLFEGWPSDLDRFQQVVCYLSDIGWRYHPDYRARRAFETVLTIPVAGLTHQARAFLALALAARYGASIWNSPFKPARRLLDEDFVRKAQVVGTGLRLAYQISGAVAGLLPHTSIEKKGKTIVLSFDGSQAPLSGEIVQRRYAALADALELESRIELL